MRYLNRMLLGLPPNHARPASVQAWDARSGDFPPEAFGSCQVTWRWNNQRPVYCRNGLAYWLSKVTFRINSYYCSYLTVVKLGDWCFNSMAIPAVSVLVHALVQIGPIKLGLEKFIQFSEVAFVKKTKKKCFFFQENFSDGDTNVVRVVVQRVRHRPLGHG